MSGHRRALLGGTGRGMHAGRGTSRGPGSPPSVDEASPAAEEAEVPDLAASPVGRIGD